MIRRITVRRYDICALEREAKSFCLINFWSTNQIWNSNSNADSNFCDSGPQQIQSRKAIKANLIRPEIKAESTVSVVDVLPGR